MEIKKDDNLYIYQWWIAHKAIQQGVEETKNRKKRQDAVKEALKNKTAEEIAEIKRRKMKESLRDAKDAGNEHMVKLIEKYDFNMKKYKLDDNFGNDQGQNLNK